MQPFTFGSPLGSEVRGLHDIETNIIDPASLEFVSRSGKILRPDQPGLGPKFDEMVNIVAAALRASKVQAEAIGEVESLTKQIERYSPAGYAINSGVEPYVKLRDSYTNLAHDMDHLKTLKVNEVLHTVDKLADGHEPHHGVRKEADTRGSNDRGGRLT